MSNTQRNINPRFLRRKYSHYYGNEDHDPDFVEGLRRGLFTQSLIKDDIHGWPEGYCGLIGRRRCKRRVTKQRRNLAKRDLQEQLKEFMVVSFHEKPS